MSVNIFGDGTQIINSASAQLGNTAVRTFTRTLGNTLNDAVNICTLNMTAGACVVDLNVVQSEGSNSISKTYKIPIQYNSATQWKRVTSIYGTGGYSGNDFEVDISSGISTATLRLVRTAIGTSISGANITCSLQISQSSNNTVTIVDTNTASSAVTNTGLYAFTPVSAASGRVGIGTSNPTEVFQVVGKAYVDTQILGSSNDSASNPSFSFKENSNTGMFHPTGTDILGFSTAGVERIRINESGNVGIGTTAPAANTKLHVAGHTYTSTLSVGLNETSSNGVPTTDAVVMYMEDGVFGANQDAFIIEKTDGNGATPDGGIAISRRGNNGVRTIDMTVKGGNVGIGVLNPGQKLDVTGSIRASSQLISTVAMGTAPLAVTSSNLVTNLNADFLDGQTSAYYLNPANLSAAVAVNKGGTGQTTLGSSKLMVGNGTNAVLTPTNLHWDSNNSRLGIGTALPGQTLHVVGDARIQGNLTVNGTTTVVDTNTSTTEQLSITNDGTGPAVIVNQTGAQPIMRLQDDGVTVFELADGGNLGLGTTAPNEKLDVMAKGRFMTSGVTDSLILQNTDTAAGARANILFLTSSNSTQYELGTRNTVGNPNNAFYLYAKNVGGTAVNAYRMVIDESGNMGLGGITAPGQKLDVTGSIRASSQLISTVAMGTAPLAVTSSNLVTNLNADFLDGLNSASYFRADAGNSVDVRLTQGDGRGLRFWEADAYKIYMSAASNTTWGGRVAGDTTSDYNIYFRNGGGGTNRGFVFQNGTSSVGGIDGSGNIRCIGHIDAGTQFYGNSADTSNAPGYTWDGDTNVGMYRPAADTIGFTCAGVERVRISSAGNMGIGNTDPLNQLIVQNTTARTDTITATLPVTFVPDMVINRRHGSASVSGLTYPGPALSFRAFNGTNTWDTGTIMGAVDGLNGTNTSGGLFFYTAAGGQPGGYTDGRNAGGAQSLALALGFNQNVYMPGNVGIGQSNPGSYKLYVNGGQFVNGTLTATTFSGALSGNASTATTLQTARAINGVNFDGSAAITITANTPQTLTRGSYLTGANFNGGTATTWAVDATTTNTASKVVARDASGHIYGTYLFSDYLNMSHAASSRTADTIFYSSTDDYLRKTDAAGMRSSLNVPTRTGGDASGTWAINISGTATNLRTQSVANITTRTESGFWEYSAATTTLGWPETTNMWYHLIASTHTNTTNYYSMQLAAPFYDASKCYFRVTNGAGTTAWRRVLLDDTGLNADNITSGTIANARTTATSANTANAIVARDANGDFTGRYIYSDYLNMSHGATARTTDTVFYSSTDNFIRKTTAAGMRTALAVLPLAGGTLSGQLISTFASGNGIPSTQALYIFNSTNTAGQDAAACVRTGGASGGSPYYSLDINGVIGYSLGIDNSDADKFKIKRSWHFTDGALAADVANTFVITTGGNIGINTSAPSYRLHVTGDIYATSDVYAFSDCNYKENISPILNAINKVSQLTGYTYSWKDDSDHRMHAGLLAQEVERVLPEAVNQDQDGKKSVAYGNMVSLLIQAMNEQTETINKQQQIIENLLLRVQNLETKLHP